MPTAARLTRDDWTAAALAAMSGGEGLAAVAVEPLARRLGATKGSFYWHFANRDALIAAALLRWEQEGTEDVIAWIEAEAVPRERLRLLWSSAVGLAQEDLVESAVLAAAAHPLVGPVLERVTRRRIAYLAGLFAALGFPPAQARDRGILAYTAYLGQVQLIQAGLAVPAEGATLRRYVDRMMRIVTAPE